MLLIELFKESKYQKYNFEATYCILLNLIMLSSNIPVFIKGFEKCLSKSAERRCQFLLCKQVERSIGLVYL